jgi:hypothetical protein
MIGKMMLFAALPQTTSFFRLSPSSLRTGEKRAGVMRGACSPTKNCKIGETEEKSAPLYESRIEAADSLQFTSSL